MEAIRVAAGTASPIERERTSVSVFHYSRGGMERVDLDEQIGSYVVIDGQIYDLLGRRWSGTRFVNSNEHDTEYVLNRLRNYDWDTPEDGWRSRTALMRGATATRLEMTINHKPILWTFDPTWRRYRITVTGNENQASEIWTLDTMPNFVSHAVYEAAFR